MTDLSQTRAAEPAVARGRPFGARLLLSIALWTVPATLSVFETVMFARISNRPTSALAAFASEAPQWYIWALLTPLIVRVAERFSLERKPRGRAIAAHVLALVAAALISAVASASFPLLFLPPRFPFFTSVRNWLLGGSPVDVLVYCAIVAATYAVRYRERLRERERHAEQLAAQLAESQLSALRMQLQPHFLFNSLNAITALVRDNETSGAVRALTLLGDVLRATLRAGTTNEITLGDEIDFIERYLEIERVRFGDRLVVVYSIPPELERAAVPTFILQPFVENALRHGILDTRSGGSIWITATAEDGVLHLTVRDDGRGLAVRSESPGIGIANARARIERLYGSYGGVSVVDAADGGAVARVQVPLKYAVAPPAPQRIAE